MPTQFTPAQSHDYTLFLSVAPLSKVVSEVVATQTSLARFWVVNPTFRPRSVGLQVFQRSFSTTGPDRELGTYTADNSWILQE